MYVKRNLTILFAGPDLNIYCLTLFQKKQKKIKKR